MKIKRFLFFIAFMVLNTLNSQDIILSFSAKDESSNDLELDKIVIDNLTTNKTISLEDDFSINLSTSTLSLVDNESLQTEVLKVFPNPTSKVSNILFYNNSIRLSEIVIYDALGREVASFSKNFDLGNITLQFTPNTSGWFYVHLKQGNKTYFAKILATNPDSDKASIQEIITHKSKLATKNNLFFSLGDQLKYTAHYKDSKHEVIDSPKESTNINFKINSIFYFDSNGVTIKAYDDVVVGTESFFHESIHKLVNREMLEDILANSLSVKAVTTKIENMDFLLKGLKDFNEDISSWDVSSVTSMHSMFSSAESFNQDIGYWDVSKVTDMTSMFLFANNFNQELDKWDVSNVENMTRMFGFANSFNQNIGSWNVSNVKHMLGMFIGASKFNQDISKWNVSNVIDMNAMFQHTSSFNQDIGSWDVSSVEDMSSMFSGSTLFNQDISNWNIGNVENLSAMFQGALSFNQNINEWNTTNVTNMSSVFNRATSFNQRLGNWNVANVKNMDNMFNEAVSFNQDISKWYVCSVTSFEDFSKLSSNQWLESEKPFLGSESKCEGEYPNLLFYQDNNGVTVKATEIALVGSKGIVNGFIYELVDLDILKYKIDNNKDLRYVVTTGIKDMSKLLEYESFINADKDISTWDVSEVTNMSSMFYRTRYLFPDISLWDVSKVEDMSDMFRDSESVAPNLESWNVSKVKNMSGMFRNAYSFNSDISSWDVSNVTNMESMFREVHSFDQDINSWDVSNVKDMSYMFRDTRYYQKDLNNWDVSNVEIMRQMFYSSSYKRDISSWNVCNVNDYSNFTLNNLWNEEFRPSFGDPNKCTGN